MADEIKKIQQTLKDLHKSGKHEEAAKFMAKGATFITPTFGAVDAAGMAALRKEGKFAKFDNIQATHTSDDIKVFGDIAVDRGTLKVETSQGPKEGNFLTVWTKAEGSWKILTSCTTMRIEIP